MAILLRTIKPEYSLALLFISTWRCMDNFFPKYNAATPGMI